MAFCMIGCEFGATNEEYLQAEEVRGKLALDVPSYSNVNEVKDFFNLQDDQIIVLEDSHSAASPKRPQFSIFTMKVKNFEIDGHTGEFELSFFNERLYWTRFYPQDFEAFIANLKLDRGALESKQGVMKDPFTRMWIYNLPEGQRQSYYYYIGWEDIRLGEQHSNWIKNYA